MEQNRPFTESDLKSQYFDEAASKRNTIALFYSGTVLTVFNLIPLLGVIFLHWEAAHLVFLYWLENLFIGFLNLFKGKKAEGHLPSDIDVRTGKIREKLPPFRKNVSRLLILIYFVFTAVHGIFVLLLFAVTPSMMKRMLPAAAVLAVSHLFSYFYHFIHRKEYRVLTYHEVLMAPYQRMVILHLTVLFCGYLVSVRKTESIWPVLFMVLIKVAFDLFKHVRSHRKLFPAGPDSVKKNTVFRPVNPAGLPLVVFALFSIGGIGLFIIFKGDGRIPVAVFTFLFLIITAGLLSAYIGRKKKPGKMEFLLPFGCGLIPGSIEGVLRLTGFRNPVTFFEVELSCRGKEVIYRKSGNTESSETREVSIWKESKDLSVHGHHISSEFEMPVSFIIPPFLPPTTIGRSIANVTWRLEVKVNEVSPRGKDLNRTFTFSSIPVLKTETAG